MNKRILLIEDNAQNRYLANFLLESRGWEMVHAEDGPTGVALAAQVEPVLILLDIQLPGMDGYAVAHALRADPKLGAIPIMPWPATGSAAWPQAATATSKSPSTLRPSPTRWSAMWKGLPDAGIDR